MTREEYEKRRRALEEQLRADMALMNAAHETRPTFACHLFGSAQADPGPGEKNLVAPVDIGALGHERRMGYR